MENVELIAHLLIEFLLLNGCAIEAEILLRTIEPQAKLVMKIADESSKKIEA